MRKFKGTIISLSILLILIVGYFLVKFISVKINTDEGAQNFGDVFTVNREDIVYMSVNNSYGDYSFELSDGVWSCLEDKAVELDQDTVSIKVFSTSYYDAYTIKEGEYNPADYGFDNPNMVVKIRLKNGKEHTFTYGAQAPTDDFLYYLKIDNNPAVYTVFGSKYDTLNVPLGAYRGDAFFTFDYQGIKKFSISSKDKEPIVIQQDSSSNSSNWLMTSPYNKLVNAFTLSDLIIAPLSEQTIEIMSYVADNPSSLSPYGLDDPQHVISFEYENNTETIKLGNFSDEGGIYAMNSHSQTVYTVKYDYFSFVEYTAFEYIDKNVHYAVISDLASFSVNNGTNNYNLTIPSSEGDYKINGNTITEDSAKSFYAEVASLSIGGVIKEDVTSDAEIVFTYKYKNGNLDKVEFIPYSSRNYAVSINGGNLDFYVKKEDVSSLISRIADL